MNMPTSSSTETRAGNSAIAIWLLACCGLVAAIIVIGGATRLTGSGLSIVVWEPIMGIIPPLSERAWLEAFELYRQSPQYQQVNAGMSLEAFKFIFWWEYWHRVAGRLIGVVFFAGFVYFLSKRRLDTPTTIKLSGLLVLGGLQGFMGWYMVSSGLVDVPHVSHYRLAAHLGLALLIYSLMLWFAMDILQPRGASAADGAGSGLRRAAWGLLVLVAVTILFGAFVAGTHAGFFYNTFPLMNGQWIPQGMWTLEPWPRNLLANPIAIQFAHRWIALLTFAAVAAFWLVALRSALPRQARIAVHFLLAAALLQVALGISTLVLQVPIVLGVAHQGGAVVLLTALLYLLHSLHPARVAARTPTPVPVAA